MNLTPDTLQILQTMCCKKLQNHIVPGLSSSLLGGEGHGTVRLFESMRQHEENITPHSHRFDFTCLVLTGSVRNVIWTEQPATQENCDWYTPSHLLYHGEVGEYTQGKPLKPMPYKATEQRHKAGDWYSVRASEIHSIHFSRGARVLFFEGPTVMNETTILQPWVHGETLPTFEVKPWMFQPHWISKK